MSGERLVAGAGDGAVEAALVEFGMIEADVRERQQIARVSEPLGLALFHPRTRWLPANNELSPGGDRPSCATQ